VKAAAKAVSGEVVLDAPAAVAPKSASTDQEGQVVVAEVVEGKRKEEASGNNKA
jgi:hypothetical protein